MARTSVKSNTKILKETTTKTKKSQESKKEIFKKDTKKTSSTKSSDTFSQKDSSKKSTKKNDRILEVKTTQTGALKQVIERISNFISDCVIVFIPPDESIKEEEDDDYYEEIDENEVKPKKKNIKKTKKINDDDDDENKDDEPKSKKKSNKKTKKIDDDDVKPKSNSKNSNGKTQKKNTGGIRILRLTEDKSILVKLHLDAINFEQFRCDEPKITIGVDMHNLHALLKMVNDDDPIVLYMNRDNRSSLYIRSLNENNESSEETDIEIFLMEIGHTEMPIPQTEFQNKITMASDKFHTICKHMNNNSTYVEITSINNEILFRGKNEGGKVTMSYKDVNYNSKKKDKPDQVVQGVYELRNLMGFSKCNKLCNTIEIYLKNDFPLVLVISVATLGKMYVFLSPIESGDN
ncbi:putative DNA polymerase sliding clamp [Tupanvirus soda lake]|uniref:DNA polymerase sliding clamp n=2 Tax=Tupanvirus TaxID=2094720 RepID=A0AC62ACG7_9VIRU|nr:putative DNA polymerase sliding clamp [Tupanvirus soda lake]QKU35482.1 putative DNA polymerase sliding clamp [Tupanvirus soda lake]